VYIAIEDLMEEGKSLLLRDRQPDLDERPPFDLFFVMSELAQGLAATLRLALTLPARCINFPARVLETL
jgi:hypothetical protein